MTEETWSMLETNGISKSMFVIQCYQNIEKLGLRLCVSNEAFIVGDQQIVRYPMVLLIGGI